MTSASGQHAHGFPATALVGKKVHQLSLTKKAMSQLELHPKINTEFIQLVNCGSGEHLFPWLANNAHVYTG